MCSFESLAETGLVPAHILEEDEEEYHPAPGDDDYEGDQMERGASENVPAVEMAPVTIASSTAVSASTNSPSNSREAVSTTDVVDIDVVKLSVADNGSVVGSVSSSDPSSPQA